MLSTEKMNNMLMFSNSTTLNALPDGQDSSDDSTDDSDTGPQPSSDDN